MLACQAAPAPGSSEMQPLFRLPAAVLLPFAASYGPSDIWSRPKAVVA